MLYIFELGLNFKQIVDRIVAEKNLLWMKFATEINDYVIRKICAQLVKNFYYKNKKTRLACGSRKRKQWELPNHGLRDLILAKKYLGPEIFWSQGNNYKEFLW